MKINIEKSFDKDYIKLPRVIQKRCDKQLLLLLRSPRHQSLRTSKIQGFRDIWEGRITKDYRFSFQVIKDTYIIRRVGKHDEVLKKP